MMKHFISIFTILFLIVFVSCELSQNNKQTSILGTDSLKKISNITNPDSLKIADSLRIQKSKQRLKLKFKDIKFVPVFDKRLSIVGTFYDSLQTDTLTESYISQITHKETCTRIAFIYDL